MYRVRHVWFKYLKKLDRVWVPLNREKCFQGLVVEKLIPHLNLLQDSSGKKIM
jgi:hypothetical protein